MRINPRLVCIILLLFAATATFAQAPNTPTSGAMLTISGSVNNIPVKILIYDSQIHSGSVLSVPVNGTNNPPTKPPTCTTADAAVPTDAYVLQGGSATGCDPGDNFEVTDGNTNSPHQSPGMRDITLSAGLGSATLPGGGFHVETHYCLNNSTCGAAGVATVAGSWCNTSGTICANPDTGFLSVTNNTGYSFTGTISLQGTSPIAGTPFCPTGTDANGNGVANDNWTTGLTISGATQSVTLALGTAPPPLDPATADTSNCGGFNFDQVSAPMASNTQATTFTFGKDKFTVTPVNINIGDILTFRPVPMPAGQFNLPGPNLTGSPLGNGSQCVSIADFAAPGNPVCPEFQTHCLNPNALKNPPTCDDAETFLWTGEFDAHLDPNAGYPLVNNVPEVGGVHFLGAPGVNCAQNSFSEDIVSAYTGDSPGDLPLKSGGSGLNCFVTSFDASAAPIPQGVTVTPFTGFFTPVSDTALNAVQLGRTVPLKFSLASGAGGAPVTNLTLCSSLPCTGVATPWIFLGTTPLSCSTAAADTSGTNYTADDTLLTSSGLQNLGGGNYLFTWKIPKTNSLLNTCAAVNVQLSTGLVLLDVATFKFGNQ